MIAYHKQGVRLERHLFGLGEPLSAESQHYNHDGSGIRIATLATDTGVIREGKQVEGTIIVGLSTPLAWSDGHKAYAISDYGITGLEPVERTIAATELTFSIGKKRPNGIAIFHDDNWLGTWIFSKDVTALTRCLLTDAGDWEGALKFAVNGRLPILASGTPTTSGIQSRLATESGIDALCSLTRIERNGHVIRHLLEYWQPGSKLAETILRQSLRVDANKKTDTKTIERLIDDAPCAAIRIMIDGLKGLPKVERRIAMDRLVRKLANNVHTGDVLPASVSAIMHRSEQHLLATAMAESDLDQNFLASKSDQSVASLGWAHATSVKPARYAGNLATVMTIAPIRRWLASNLLSRVITQIV